DLAENDVEVRLRTEVESVRAGLDGMIETRLRGPEGAGTVTTRSLYNCTYSRLNRLLSASDLPLIHLKHELTEMPLVEVPDEIQGKGFTMMCGPFFSIMPFPPRGLYTLSHVRYTPHAQWADRPGEPWRDPYLVLAGVQKHSNFPHMIRDVSRYMPCLKDCRQVDSLWEVKTVLPKSEVDDSRPVLYREHCGLPNLTCMLGAKIDNIYDVLEVVRSAEVSPATETTLGVADHGIGRPPTPPARS
ncbi:MAG: D amino acid oxidase (DAO) family protein, partial [Candidatus Eisenbacteria bacterium]